MRVDDLLNLPPDLPIPIDDGACAHLPGMTVPALGLPATDGTIVHLDARTRCAPSSSPIPGPGGRARSPRADESWDAIPGARGCTPQACAYRDRHADLVALGVRVLGLSTQDTAYQREAVERLDLPFPILSDETLAFGRALRLPTFATAGLTLFRRFTLILRAGRIVHVLYPVFPSDRDAEQVIAWLRGPGSTPA